MLILPLARKGFNMEVTRMCKPLSSELQRTRQKFPSQFASLRIALQPDFLEYTIITLCLNRYVSPFLDAALSPACIVDTFDGAEKR